MSMVNRRVLKRLQRQAESMMVDTCTVSRVSTVQDEEGYDVPVETPVYSGKCEISDYNQNVRAALSVGSPQNIFVCVLRLPARTDARDGDIAHIERWPRPLTLHGSDPRTWQTTTNLEAWDEVNSNA